MSGSKCGLGLGSGPRVGFGQARLTCTIEQLASVSLTHTVMGGVGLRSWEFLGSSPPANTVTQPTLGRASVCALEFDLRLMSVQPYAKPACVVGPATAGYSSHSTPTPSNPNTRTHTYDTVWLE